MYAAALTACCLEQDLEQLVDGDATEIGAWGDGSVFIKWRLPLDFGVPLGALGAKQDPSMASGFLWPYSRISSYSSRANLFLAAMLGSHGINGHQGYQQDFSTPAWDHILKTPHLMKQNKNSDQY